MNELIKTIKRKIGIVLYEPKSVRIKMLYILSPLINDKTYLKLLFYLRLDYKIDLKNPQTFNEKLNWLKLYYRKPIFTDMVDKFEVKNIIKEKIGDEYIVTNYGVWNSFDEINFEKLPNQFVLKTTHDSGGVIICKDKEDFDKKKSKKFINKHLKIRHFYLSREWPYKNVQPRIIAEELLVDDKNDNILTYKFLCFDGVPKVMYIAMGRSKGKETFDYFDMDFNHLDIERRGNPQSGKKFEKPKKWDVMIELATILSKNHPFIRVDLHNIDGRVLFNEFTFYSEGGMGYLNPQSWDHTFGSWIDLGKVENK